MRNFWRRTVLNLLPLKGLGMLLQATDLKSGDVVRLHPETADPWQDMTVEWVRRGKVMFFRPYVVNQQDPLGSGDSVHALIGVERFQVPVHTGHTYRLIRR